VNLPHMAGLDLDQGRRDLGRDREVAGVRDAQGSRQVPSNPKNCQD